MSHNDFKLFSNMLSYDNFLFFHSLTFTSDYNFRIDFFDFQSIFDLCLLGLGDIYLKAIFLLSETDKEESVFGQ